MEGEEVMISDRLEQCRFAMTWTKLIKPKRVIPNGIIPRRISPNKIPGSSKLASDTLIYSYTVKESGTLWWIAKNKSSKNEELSKKNSQIQRNWRKIWWI